MRFFIIIIAMSLSTLASGSTAIAQQEQPAPALPTADQNAAEKLNPSWYRRTLPTDLARPWVQSMAATFVWAAPDGVRGLHAGSQDNVLCPCA
jgi:hypothetical protein